MAHWAETCFPETYNYVNKLNTVVCDGNTIVSIIPVMYLTTLPAPQVIIPLNGRRSINN
jgi:hypothetical protein